jgi:hypothetical protein
MNFELDTNICTLWEHGCPGQVLVGTNSYRPFDYVAPSVEYDQCTHYALYGRNKAFRDQCAAITVEQDCWDNYKCNMNPGEPVLISGV